MGDFALHPKLAADTLALGQMMLSDVRVMNDARFPWLILVPRRHGLVGLHELERTDHFLIMQEIAKMSRLLEAAFQPDRINVGALGNMVPQLHVHVIARSETDAAWPGPVWGFGAAEPYSDGDTRLATIRAAFEAV